MTITISFFFLCLHHFDYIKDIGEFVIFLVQNVYNHDVLCSRHLSDIRSLWQQDHPKVLHTLQRLQLWLPLHHLCHFDLSCPRGQLHLLDNEILSRSRGSNVLKRSFLFWALFRCSWTWRNQWHGRSHSSSKSSLSCPPPCPPSSSAGSQSSRLASRGTTSSPLRLLSYESSTLILYKELSSSIF